MRATAKLFTHGRSQAVRLPKKFRFEGTDVRVTKVGNKLILDGADAKRRDAWALIDDTCTAPLCPRGASSRKCRATA